MTFSFNSIMIQVEMAILSAVQYPVKMMSQGIWRLSLQVWTFNKLTDIESKPFYRDINLPAVKPWLPFTIDDQSIQ